MLPQSSQIVLAPLVSGSGQGSRSWQRLQGSTSQSTTELDVGTYATIQNSSTAAIRVRWTGSASTAVSTDWPIPVGGRWDWSVDDDTKFVAVIGEGGATFEALVASTSTRGV